MNSARRIALTAALLGGCDAHKQPRDPTLAEDIAWKGVGTSAPSTQPPSAREALSLNWETVSETARTRARNEKRRMLVWIHADWSVASKKLARDVWSDPNVERMLAPLVRLQLDVSDSSADSEGKTAEFAVDSVPAVLILDETGRELSRLTAGIDAAKILAAVRSTEHRR